MIETQAGQTREAGLTTMQQKDRIREYAIWSLVSECQEFIESQSELMILLMKSDKTQEDIDRIKQLLLHRDDTLAYIGAVIRDVVLL